MRTLSGSPAAAQQGQTVRRAKEGHRVRRGFPTGAPASRRFGNRRGQNGGAFGVGPRVRELAIAAAIPEQDRTRFQRVSRWPSDRRRNPPRGRSRTILSAVTATRGGALGRSTQTETAASGQAQGAGHPQGDPQANIRYRRRTCFSLDRAGMGCRPPLPARSDQLRVFPKGAGRIDRLARARPILGRGRPDRRPTTPPTAPPLDRVDGALLSCRVTQQADWGPPTAGPPGRHGRRQKTPASAARKAAIGDQPADLLAHALPRQPPRWWPQHLLACRGPPLGPLVADDDDLAFPLVGRGS